MLEANVIQNSTVLSVFGALNLESASRFLQCCPYMISYKRNTRCCGQ